MAVLIVAGTGAAPAGGSITAGTGAAPAALAGGSITAGTAAGGNTKLVGAGTQAENTINATSLAVPYPAGITAGHVLVLTFSVNTATVQNVAGLVSAGWTTVFNGSSTTSTLSPALYVGIKVAAGGETGSLAVATTNVTSIGQILAFSGVDNTTPQDVAAGTVDQITALATTSLPSRTTGGTGRALVYAAALNSTTSTATAPTAPATFTETMDRSAGNRAATMGYLIWTGSGATGTVGVLFSGSARSLGVLLVLRPTVASVFGRVHYIASTAPAAPVVPPPTTDEYRAMSGLAEACVSFRAKQGGWA